MKLILDNKLGPRHLLRSDDTAVLCIHWQNDIVEQAGAFGAIFSEEVKHTGALDHTVALVRNCRSLGLPVIHVVATYADGHSGLVVNNALFQTVKLRNAFVVDSWGWEICGALAPEPDELVLRHSRINCFYGTDLAAYLVGRGIKNLAFTGVATNVAVDHSVREAVQAGWNTYLLEDCCCSSNKEFHAAAMLTMNALSTHVITSTRFIEVLQVSHRAQ